MHDFLIGVLEFAFEFLGEFPLFTIERGERKKKIPERKPGDSSFKTKPV